MKIDRKSILLIGLLVVSFFIRIYRINTLSLFGDEIDVGYQAYSLLNTAKDYRGNFLPTYIQSLSESRAPLLIYTSIPGIKLFGLTELGVRITPIVFGVLSIYLFYKLILLYSDSFSLAFFSSLALSFSPWHFHYSRTSFEVTLLLSLILLGIYLFQKFIQNSNIYFLYLAIISFGLTFYTYNTANIFVPLLVIFLILTNVKKVFSLKPQKIIISLGLTILFIAPIFLQIVSGKAANRFGLISIFNDQKTISHIIEQRTSPFATDPKTERVFYNKFTGWTSVFFQNYLESISPTFIFNQGDINNLRHNLPKFGLLFLSFAPLLFIGLIKSPKNKLRQLMFFWLLISPIASSLTIQGGHHPTRLFIMLPPLAFFIGQGITNLISSPKIMNKLLLVLLSGLLIFEVSFYHHEYFNRYPKENFKIWNYGYKEIFTSLSQQSYNRLLISNSNYNSLLPYLFYNRISPTAVTIDDHEKKNLITNMPGFQISNNVYFINNWEHIINYYNEIFNKLDQVSQSGDVLVLFQLNEIPGDIDLSREPRGGYQTIKTIYNPDKTILAQIIKKI